MTHLKFFYEEGKGVTPFVFGSNASNDERNRGDIRAGMLDDEANFVDGTHRFRLGERHKRLMQGQTWIHEVLEMAAGDEI